MKKGLFALALGTFTLGMTEFIIEGILTDVAHDMNVSIPQVGHLISIYALGVCTGAFSLILMHKYRPKNILMFLTSLITIGAVIASIAPSFWLLLCARFIQGLPHGAYFGTGAIVAVKIAKEGKGTSAVAMMCAGIPFANLIGVPLGTFLSHNISWRVPFMMSIVLGLTTLYMIYRWVPNVAALANNGMKAQFRFLRNLAPWLIILATFLGSAGMLCWFSYISPLLQMKGGFSASSISLLMILAGFGMVVGNLSSGPLADRFKPGRITSCYLLTSAIGRTNYNALVIDSVKVNLKETNGIKNVFGNKIKVSAKNGEVKVAGASENYHIQICDVLGRVLLSQNSNANNTYAHSCKKALLFVTISQNGKQQTYKLITN